MIEKIKVVWKTRFGKDVAITIAGQMVVLLAAFGLNKWLSISLGTSGYGEFSIAKRTSGVISYVMFIGMGIALPKYLATYRQMGDRINEARYIISALLMIGAASFITLVIIITSRESLAQILFVENGFSGYILPILLYAFSMTLVSVIYSYYRGYDKFIMYNISQIIVQAVTLFLAFIFDKDVVDLLYAWSIVTGGYGIYFCWKTWFCFYPNAQIKSLINDLKPVIVELAKFCIPRVPGEFILFAYGVTPLIIINHKLGMETSAYFAAATSINTMVTPFFGFVGVVLLPLVSKSIVSNQFSEAESKIKILARIYLVLCISGIAFVEAFAPFLVNLLFSPQYLPAVPIVRILILAILPNSFYLLLRNPLDGISRIPYNTINLLISFLVLNILVYFSSNTLTFSMSFVAANGLLGLMSIWSWGKCKKNFNDAKKLTYNI